jgi:hypothetical protein
MAGLDLENLVGTKNCGDTEDSSSNSLCTWAYLPRASRLGPSRISHAICARWFLLVTPLHFPERMLGLLTSKGCIAAFCLSLSLFRIPPWSLPLFLSCFEDGVFVLASTLLSHLQHGILTLAHTVLSHPHALDTTSSSSPNFWICRLKSPHLCQTNGYPQRCTGHRSRGGL